MIIKNYKDKKYIETTDSEVIFYRWYGKKVLYKDKIRAAYMQDDYVVRILYGEVIRSYNICNMKNNEKIKLKEFIDSLNNEKLIFSGKNYGDARGAIGIMFAMIFSGSILNEGIGVETFIYLIVLTILILTINKYPIYDMFIYDYENKIITIQGRDSKKKKEIRELDKNKDIVNIKYDKSGQYIIKMKFNSIILQSNIMYPINYLLPLGNSDL